MENPSSTTPGVSEKPAAARFSTPAQPAQQQQQFQQLEHLPRAEPFKTTKPFSVAKFVLGSFNLVFGIIALGLSLALVTSMVSFSSFLGIVICLSLAVVSVIWQLAEHITLAVRRGWPIHPGAHVGVHLILWVLALLVALSLFISVADDLSYYTIDADCYYDGDMPIDSYGSDGRYYCDSNVFPSQAVADRYFRMLEALAVFSVLMLISHATLFVMACVETDRRRKYGKMTKVVYLVASQGPADGRTYYAPVATQVFSHNNRGSILPPQPANHNQQQRRQSQHQQGNADPGVHGYYAPPGGVLPGTAA